MHEASTRLVHGTRRVSPRRARDGGETHEWRGEDVENNRLIVFTHNCVISKKFRFSKARIALDMQDLAKASTISIGI